MAGRILCLEGPSAVGKTTLASELARAFGGAEIVAELSSGQGPNEDTARWFMEQHVARWHRAHALASHAPFVILDGDPFKGLWYNWIYTANGWPSVEATAEAYREHIRRGTLAFPDLYVLLHATETQLRLRRSSDPTRTRRNFEKHLALIGPQRRYFETMNEASPGRVLFLETTDRDTLIFAINDAITALGSDRIDNVQLLETLVVWLHSQDTPVPQ